MTANHRRDDTDRLSWVEQQVTELIGWLRDTERDLQHTRTRIVHSDGTRCGHGDPPAWWPDSAGTRTTCPGGLILGGVLTLTADELRTSRIRADDAGFFASRLEDIIGSSGLAHVPLAGHLEEIMRHLELIRGQLEVVTGLCGIPDVVQVSAADLRAALTDSGYEGVPAGNGDGSVWTRLARAAWSR